jgi:hypothetical protein
MEVPVDDMAVAKATVVVINHLVPLLDVCGFFSTSGMG